MEKTPDADKPTFEASLEQLQSLVKKLESGELSLEQSLKGFEEGVHLTRICQDYLTVAEQRIQVLTQVGPDGKPDLQPFQPGRG